MAPKLASGATPCLRTLQTTTRASSAPQLQPLVQTRAATYVHRPRRPYTFTQLIKLSDGSTYTLRTTSPVPMFRTERDSRNTLLWQPSAKDLRNVEHDEAGKLAAFRQRYGTSFEISAATEEDKKAAAKAGAAKPRRGGRALRATDIKKMEALRKAEDEAARKAAEEDEGLDLGDLISGYAPPPPTKVDTSHLAQKVKAKKK